MNALERRTGTGGQAKADQVWWTVEVPQYESLEEAIDEIPGGEQGVVDHLNKLLDQDAKQGDKGTVLEAVKAAREAGYDLRNVSLDDVRERSEADGRPEVLETLIEAIEEHQSGTLDTRLGVARTGNGPTKTELRERLDRVYEEQGAEAAAELLAEYEA